MAASSSSSSLKELSQQALLANKDHQYALKVYTERLEAELDTVDKLLAAAETPEDDIEVDVGGSIVIPGSIKAVGLLTDDVTLEKNPFAEDAAQRRRYLKATTIHPMKTPELDALSDAVRSENHRLYALEAQKRGQQPFVGLDDHPPGFFELNKNGLNWDRIASKVSAAGVNYVQRTAQECEIRWLGDRHPEFNHSPWSQAEIDRVKELIGDNPVEGQIDWVDIAARLGTKRTPIECMRHAIVRKPHVWTPESDQRLLDAVKIYGTGSWLQVARQVSEDSTAAQCQSRYTRSLDPTLRHGPWTAEEDMQLKRAVEVYGRSWIDIATWVSTRSNEQCRDRWQETLNPTNRGKWTEEEDQTLLDAYDAAGGPKWKEISQMVGRSDNMCRHRFTLLMKQRAKSAATSPTPSAPASPSPSEAVAGPSRPRGQPKRQQALPATLETAGEPAIEAIQDWTSVSEAGTRVRGRRAAQVGASQDTLAESQPSSALPPVIPEHSQPATTLKPKPRPRRTIKQLTTPQTETSEPNDVEMRPPDTEPSATLTNEPPPQQSDNMVSAPPRRQGRPRKQPLPPVADAEPPPAKKRRITRKNHAKDAEDNTNGAVEMPTAREDNGERKDIDIAETGPASPSRRRSARHKIHNDVPAPSIIQGHGQASNTGSNSMAQDSQDIPVNAATNAPSSDDARMVLDKDATVSNAIAASTPVRPSRRQKRVVQPSDRVTRRQAQNAGH